MAVGAGDAVLAPWDCVWKGRVGVGGGVAVPPLTLPLPLLLRLLPPLPLATAVSTPVALPPLRCEGVRRGEMVALGLEEWEGVTVAVAVGWAREPLPPPLLEVAQGEEEKASALPLALSVI